MDRDDHPAGQRQQWFALRRRTCRLDPAQRDHPCPRRVRHHRRRRLYQDQYHPHSGRRFGRHSGLLSKWVASGTVYFEKWASSTPAPRCATAHRSWASSSASAVSWSTSGSLGETIVDGQIGYDFGGDSMLKGLSVYLQGQNLTNEPEVSISNGSPLQIMNYQSYGRRFMAGFTYKF
ncbi:MAG: TonB-dependent receptor [Novosphingobium sp.]